jgi:hypothetical protein
MVEIRVAVTDATTATGLFVRLAGQFDLPSVSLDASRAEICVRSEADSRAVIHVINTVESWLESDGAGAATLSIGDRSYTMGDPSTPRSVR